MILLNQKDSAEKLGITYDAFRRFIDKGIIPKGRKLGRVTAKSGRETVWSITVLDNAKDKVEHYKRGDHVTDRQRRNQARANEGKRIRKEEQERITTVFNEFMGVNTAAFEAFMGRSK